MKIGKVPENVLKRSVLRQIKTKREEVASGAGMGKDCAIFAFPESETGALASCVQEGVLAVAGGNPVPEACMTISELIQKCANNLAVGGGGLMAVMLTLFFPENTQETDIRAVMAEAENKCQELDVEIAGGQTRITAVAAAPIAVVTGYGAAPRKEHCTAAPGQDIVVSKWIGLQGTAIAAKRYRERLLERYPAYFVEEAAGFDRYLSVLPEAAAALGAGACAMHDASEGGIFGALWEMVEDAGVGMKVDMRKLPLRQETVEVCECLDLNPYELLSGGCLLMTAPDGAALLEALEKAGVPGAIVGKVTEGNDRILICGDEIRYMERPKQDSIWRLSDAGI